MKSYLQARGISCWKAPEDIPFGMDWDVGIKNGLAECPVMVLIFSKAADESKHVKIEVHKASQAEKVVIPFKIEDHIPDNLDYYLTFPQWLEAIGDIEGAFEKLYQRLKSIVEVSQSSAPVVDRPANPPSSAVSSQPSTEPVPPAVEDKDKHALLSVLPEYGEWATHQELRSRFNWGIEHLTAVLTALKAEDQIFYRGSYGGCVALRTDELADLNSRLKSGVEPYPYFVNVGDDSENQTSSEQPWRCWEDYKRNNCFGAGGGARFRDAMKAIPVGSEVYLYQSGYGYIGQARTVSSALPMKEFLVDGVPITNQPLKGVNSMSVLDDYEMCEWLVAIDQFKSLEPAHAIAKKGLFVYLATSCRILDVVSLRYLRNAFAQL